MIIGSRLHLDCRLLYALTCCLLILGLFLLQYTGKKLVYLQNQVLADNGRARGSPPETDADALGMKSSKLSSSELNQEHAGETIKHQASAEVLWSKLQPALDSFSPNISDLRILGDLEFIAFDANTPDWAPDLLRLNASSILALRDAHQGYVRSIQSIARNYVHDPAASQRGVVMTASSSYLPALAVSLRMLRFAGTALPVEVWIGKQDEYEVGTCEILLKQLNARCRVIEDVFLHKNGAFKPQREFIKYEYKIFAILFSTFQEIVYLDADSFPLHPLEELLDSDPFRRTGLVLWPDIWREAVSPAYYLINGGKPRHRGVRAATESGQMLINKGSHFAALLLAAYYNYYGESHYYTLLSQNGPGRGDKDTFLPAAEAMHSPFWQVREPVASIGHDSGMNYGGFILALIQFDPVQDFHRHRDEKISTLSNHKPSPPLAKFDWSDDHQPPRMFFMHCNSRKWNPREVLEFRGGYDLAWNAEREPANAYTDPPELAERLGYTERVIWDQVRWVACDSGIEFRDWRGARDEICDKITRYYFTFIDPQPGWDPYVPPASEGAPDWLDDMTGRKKEPDAADGEEGGETYGDAENENDEQISLPESDIETIAEDVG